MALESLKIICVSKSEQKIRLHVSVLYTWVSIKEFPQFDIILNYLYIGTYLIGSIKGVRDCHCMSNRPSLHNNSLALPGLHKSHISC